MTKAAWQSFLALLGLSGLALSLAAGDAFAYDYVGHLMTGAFISHEAYPNAVTGSKDNDLLVYSNRAYLDVTNITAAKYEFVTDIRDNHDFFDKVDAARLNLSGENKFRLRLLAVKDPGATHGYLWSVGRFLPADNGIIYNDGAEVGVKASHHQTLGVFAGFRPRVNDERAVELKASAFQLGAYDVYQNDPEDWSEGTYSSNMLVFAPRVFTDVAPTEALAYINQSILHFGPNDRVNTYLDLQARPEVRAADAVVSYDHRFDPRLNATATYSRIDLTEYRNNRDIFETLTASSYQQLKTQGRYKLSDYQRLDANFSYGERYLDHLRRLEVSAGTTWTRLLGGHFTDAVLAGYRRNFLSNDLFIYNSATHYSDDWEVSGDLRYTVQHKDTGENLHPVIAGASVGHVFAKAVLGSIGGEYARDEKTTISSGLFSLGYRFGNREFTPVRDVAPPSERF